MAEQFSLPVQAEGIVLLCIIRAASFTGESWEASGPSSHTEGPQDLLYSKGPKLFQYKLFSPCYNDEFAVDFLKERKFSRDNQISKW